MEKSYEVNPGDRCRVSSDAPFKCYFARPDGTALFVGPPTADLRITSFTVPAGERLLIVDCDADAVTTVDLTQNRFAACDPASLVTELQSDRPRDVRDLIANMIGEYMRKNDQTSATESIEEANDFELDDLDWADEPFAREHEARIVREEYLYAESDSADSGNPAEGPPEPEEPEAPPDEVVNS